MKGDTPVAAETWELKVYSAQGRKELPLVRSCPVAWVPSEGDRSSPGEEEAERKAKGHYRMEKTKIRTIRRHIPVPIPLIIVVLNHMIDQIIQVSRTSPRNECVANLVAHSSPTMC